MNRSRDLSQPHREGQPAHPPAARSQSPRGRSVGALLPIVLLVVIIVVFVAVPEARELFSRENLLRVVDLAGI